MTYKEVVDEILISGENFVEILDKYGFTLNARAVEQIVNDLKINLNKND